tara:strand:- start:5528 stop:6367 length:840 start_codon:yes stop_codon:yes gene_type:complete
MFHVEQKKTYIEVVDHFLTKEKFKIQKTPVPGLLQTIPTPTKEDIIKYYKSERYISHNSRKAGVFFFFYRFLRSINFYAKYRFLSSTQNNRNVLDFGSGEGYFLNKLKKRGIKSCGVDSSPSPSLTAVYKSIFAEELNSQKFSHITAWHSIEHVHELEKTISRMYDLLDEKGTIIVGVPNYLSFDARYYKRFWAAYDVPRHLWHFDKKSLKEVFENKGFKLVKSSPLILDAYYVSLLSESYQKSTLKLLKSIFVGTISNTLAFFNKEYSSNIFVFKKLR